MFRKICWVIGHCYRLAHEKYSTPIAYCRRCGRGKYIVPTYK